jgi:2-(3-amino-3-carboxypropyl)histidine synthase
MTLRIDDARVFQLLEEKRPSVVVINAPGGLLRQVRELMEVLRHKYGVKCIFAADSCFGICDTVDKDVSSLEADMVLHIGHNAVSKTMGEFTYLIDAVDDVSFDDVVEKAASALKESKRIGLVTFSQHLHQLEPVRAMLERKGFEVCVGRNNGLLMGSQMFGCDFSTVYALRDKVDAFCFLGESEFHAVGLALSTGKPTYMLDPYLNVVVDMKEAAEERRKRAILAVYSALDAKVFGVITGLKEGQTILGRSRWISNKLETCGRKVVQLAMRDITPERLAPYEDIDAFVQTACPRISIDGFTFDKPVLSIPQVEALIALFEGREIGEFLHKPKWIELSVGHMWRRG